MYNAATSFHITIEVIFWSSFLVLSTSKVRTSFYTSVFYTNSSKSEIGTLMDLKEEETFLFDMFKKLSLYQRLYQRSGNLLQLFSDQKDHN